MLGQHTNYPELILVVDGEVDRSEDCLIGHRFRRWGFSRNFARLDTHGRLYFMNVGIDLEELRIDS